MDITWISEHGIRILETIERFQFMTAEQITRAGKFKNKAVIRRLANDYAGRRPPLLHCKDFGALPGIGRLHKIYAMSEHGAEILAEYRQCHPSEINHLTGKIQFSIDYLHRLYFINSHILIREWADKSGADISFFNGYFESEGANRSGKDAMKLQKKNKVDLQNDRYIIPDGIFSFSLGNKVRLCALEIHRGQDTKLILGQLDKHIESLYTRAIQDKFNHASGNFILSVYENPGTMEAVKKRITQNPEFSAVSKAFHFSTIEKMEADIIKAWTLADNTPVSIFI